MTCIDEMNVCGEFRDDINAYFRSAAGARRGDAVAIAAPDATALTYDGLRALIVETIASLNEIGIGRNDRVAIVLPNGPEMATAFIAISSGATSAPLNPAYRTDEFEFYMSDLGAKALVVEQAPRPRSKPRKSLGSSS